MRRAGSFVLGLLFVFSSMLTAEAAPAQMSELDIFKRCYVRLTRSVPKADHPLYAAVAAGTKSAQTACMNLLDEAKFDTKGVIRDEASAEGRRILKTINDYHRTWFQSRANYDSKPFTYLVKDAEESALYFTRAAFLPSARFDSVVTLDSGLRGVRTRVVGGNTGSHLWAQNLVTSLFTRTDLPSPQNLNVAYVDYDPATRKSNMTTLVIGANDAVQVGELIGVQAALPVIFPRFKAVATKAANLPAEDDAVTAAAELTQSGLTTVTNFDANQHFGGGILGSQNFLLNNANLGTSEFNQGTVDEALGEGGETVINRRIASRIFQDVLCHEMPTLTDKDALSSVHPTSPNSFRQNVSCQQCHAQNDNAAKMFRNLFMFNSSGTPDSFGYQITGMARLAPVKNAKTFAVQTPVGKLFYRQMLTGERVNEPIRSFAEMGAVMAANDDLYRCAVKRYYKFLTGVDVSLSSPSNKPLDAYHQNVVKDLASKLKDDQSVRSLISRIFASESFRSMNYKTEAP